MKIVVALHALALTQDWSPINEAPLRSREVIYACKHWSNTETGGVTLYWSARWNNAFQHWVDVDTNTVVYPDAWTHHP